MVKNEQYDEIASRKIRSYEGFFDIPDVVDWWNDIRLRDEGIYAPRCHLARLVVGYKGTLEKLI